jgi:hypothetical protein
MRFAIVPLPCLLLIFAGCSSYNAPKAAPAPATAPTPIAATPMFSVVAGTYTAAQTVTRGSPRCGATSPDSPRAR